MLSITGQQFNVFKSYKDAKVKPKRYGAKIQKNHDVTEYLNDNQMKMYKSRYGPNQAGEEFDNNWSGYDKGARKALRKKRSADTLTNNGENDLQPPIVRKLSILPETDVEKYFGFEISAMWPQFVVSLCASFILFALGAAYYSVYRKRNITAKVQNL